MNIVIFGAGRVGTSIADLLCRLEHSVTVVDTDPQMVARINEEIDVRAIVGSGSQSSVQFQAGISSADICLAMTGKDEVNIVDGADYYDDEPGGGALSRSTGCFCRSYGAHRGRVNTVEL